MHFRFFLQALCLGCLAVLSRADPPLKVFSKGDSIIKTNEPEQGAGIVLEPGRTMVLQCNLTVDTENQLSLHWEKDGKPIEEMKEVMIDTNNNSIIINKANEKNHTGKYMCIARDSNSAVSANVTIQVTTKPAVEQLHRSLNLVQGDPLNLKCKFSGIPLPEVFWLIDGKEVNESDTRVTIDTNMEDKISFLKIEELEYEDRAEYTCSARLGGDIANTTILIRVKDRLAALWPFLGICAEVAILCTIIFVYEKKRSKPEFEEVDADQNTENKNIDHKEGSQDVRQRK